MGRLTTLGTGLTLVLLALVPLVGRAQDATGYSPQDPVLPIPLGNNRPEQGFFIDGSFVMYLQNRPIDNQRVASRGIFDFGGVISGNAGVFAGSGSEALSVDQVKGPPSQQPGFRIGAGFRFENGSAIELSWTHLQTVRYGAVATIVPKNLLTRSDLADTFLFSPVTNFPVDFSGPPNDVLGQPAYGIWNGADNMIIDLTQRNEIYELIYRVPIFETECWRTYGLVGPRFVWFWERFGWRTNDFDENGGSLQVDEALYTNIVSNRMYGVKLGCGNEWYWGLGFSGALELYGSGFLDIVKKRAKYERGDRGAGPERKRARTDYTLAPELGATGAIYWLPPIEGVSIKLSYNLMTFYNTVGMGKPIDFDYSAVNPGYDRVFRYLRGFEVGVLFRF
jgi:hypothetical protein